MNEPHNYLVDSESFKSKIKLKGKAPAVGNTKDFRIAVPLEYFSNFLENS